MHSSFNNDMRLEERKVVLHYKKSKAFYMAASMKKCFTKLMVLPLSDEYKTYMYAL
jgi:hypothetical protein